MRILFYSYQKLWKIKKNLRQDLQFYLISYYESRLDENMDRKIQSTYKFFIQMDDWSVIQKNYLIKNKTFKKRITKYEKIK
ncbi:hypothetical protein [Blattabacterium cuenoti]|uniref:hypothetical protein n=1 Tax=Blattabacterium cuenoti TaxID=1653831 RepID=UPI00311E70DD